MITSLIGEEDSAARYPERRSGQLVALVLPFREYFVST